MQRYVRTIILSTGQEGWLLDVEINYFSILMHNQFPDYRFTSCCELEITTRVAIELGKKHI